MTEYPPIKIIEATIQVAFERGDARARQPYKLLVLLSREIVEVNAAKDKQQEEECTDDVKPAQLA